MSPNSLNNKNSSLERETSKYDGSGPQIILLETFGREKENFLFHS